MKLLSMRFLVVALLVSALAAHPAFAKKKSPFTYSCPDDEVHVEWCCPEQLDEAMGGAELVATMVCLDNGFQTFRVVEDDQIVEENHLTVTGRQGEIIIRTRSATTRNRIDNSFIVPPQLSKPKPSP